MKAIRGDVVTARDWLGRVRIYSVTDVAEQDNLIRVSRGGKGRWIRQRDVLDILDL